MCTLLGAAAAGGGPEHLAKTVEYVTPAALERYREVAGVRSRILRAPFPVSTSSNVSVMSKPFAFAKLAIAARCASSPRSDRPCPWVETRMYPMAGFTGGLP